MLHSLNLTWAEKKRCTSSWLNSGQPEAGCFSYAPTDPETATCLSFSAEAKQRRNNANKIWTWYSIVMQEALENRRKDIPSDQSQLHNSHHSIQIWSHLDFWIESVDKAGQKRLIVRGQSLRTKDGCIWMCMRLCCLPTSNAVWIWINWNNIEFFISIWTAFTILMKALNGPNFSLKEPNRQLDSEALHHIFTCRHFILLLNQCSMWRITLMSSLLHNHWLFPYHWHICGMHGKRELYWRRWGRELQFSLITVKI